MGKISTYARVRRDDDVSMKFTPTDLSIGKVTLTAPSDRIQAWTAKDKSGGAKEWDLSKDEIPKPVFFEGIKMSESAQYIDIELKFANDSCEVKDLVKATVAAIDLDVDSDNDGEVEVDDDEEDAIECVSPDANPGKMLLVDSGDVDLVREFGFGSSGRTNAKCYKSDK